MWPAIKLTKNQLQACGLPEIPGNNVTVLNSPGPMDPVPQLVENKAFHIGCPLTLKWICNCTERNDPCFDIISAVSVALTREIETHQMRLIIQKELEEHFKRNKLDNHVSKAIVDIDVELELWRRKCFAARDIVFEQEGCSPANSYGYIPVEKGEELRPKTRSWPPVEFDPDHKERSRYGRVGRKRKVPDITPLSFSAPSRSKTCNHCRTQNSALWRKGWRCGENPLRKNPSLTVPVEQGEPVDLCNICFLHWKHGSLSAVAKRKKQGSGKVKSKKKSKKSKKQKFVVREIPPVVEIAPSKVTIPLPVLRKIDPERERVLRQLKQYCPICNQVYEDDDSSSFICCDACEMWVHCVCDPLLTKEKIDALAVTNEKYTCPNCSMMQ